MSEAKQDQPEVMSADEIAALEAKLSMGDPPARKRSSSPPPAGASDEPAVGAKKADEAKAVEPDAKAVEAAGPAQQDADAKKDAAPESADPVSMRELEATTDYTPPPAGVVPAGPVSVREFLDPDDDDAEPLSLRDLERVFTPGAQPPPIGSRRPPSAPPPPLPPPRRPSAPPPPLGTVTGMLDRLTKEHAQERDEVEREEEIERGPDSGAEDLKRLASLRPDKKPDLEFEELMQMHVTPFVNVPGTPKLPSDLLSMRGGGDAGEKPRPRPPLKSRAPEAPAAEAKKPVDPDFDEGLVPPSFREPVVEAAPASVGPRSKKSKRKKGDGAKADGAKADASKEKASRSLEKAAAAIANTDDEEAAEKSIAPTSTSKPSVAKAKPAPEPVEKSSKTPLYVLLAAGLLGAGYFLGRGDDAPKPTPPTAVATTTGTPTTPAPTPTITAPTPTQTAPAAPTASAAPAETAAASAAPTATGDAPTAATGAATAATTGATTAAAPTTAATPTTAAAPATAAPTAEPATPPPAPAEGAPFDKGAASAALAAAVGQASGCKQEGDPSGSARVQVTFAPSGRVTVANVVGPPFAGTATGGCIARTFRSASVPPFSGDPVTVSKTVSIP